MHESSHDATTAAFTLSSGTIGAALSSALSRVRSIAISYGTVLHPTPASFHEPAHRLGARIIDHLWENWGQDEGGLRNGEVDLYNVNIPMIEGLLTEEGLKICWTRIWRNSYGRLFKAQPSSEAAAAASTVSPAGPDSPNEDPRGTEAGPIDKIATPKDVGKLSFRWGPDMTGLINPSPSNLPIGTDGWAISQGWVSVTPIRASFAEPSGEWNVRSVADMKEQMWKL